MKLTCPVPHTPSLRHLKRNDSVFTFCGIEKTMTQCLKQEKLTEETEQKGTLFPLSDFYFDRLCGLVVRVPGYRSRGPSSVPDTTRFSEK
jgi:hypothetical protein